MHSSLDDISKEHLQACN